MELAGELHVSRSHLHHLMKRHYNVSPQQHLLTLRIERAAILVTQQLYSLEQIARQTGYGSAFALSKAFKKIKGLSPRHYAHHLRNEDKF